MWLAQFRYFASSPARSAWTGNPFNKYMLMKNVSARHFALLLFSCLLFLSSGSHAQQKATTFKSCNDCLYHVAEGVFYDDGGESGPVSPRMQSTTFLPKTSSDNKVSLYFSEIDIPAGSKLVVFFTNKHTGEVRSEAFNGLKKTTTIVGDEITIEYYPGENHRPAKGWVANVKEVSPPSWANLRLMSQPESDCPYAIPLCLNNTAVALGGLYTDLGQINDDAGSCYSGTGQGGSVWYTFTPVTDGPLDFRITPQGTTDYDFVLWDITNGCGSGQRVQVSCNYSLYTGTTGMSGTLCNENFGDCPDNGCSNQSKAASCNRFNGRVNVSAAKRYAICINFYSGSNDGFVISFQNEPGSVAISDNTPPTVINAYANNCTSATSLRINFSEWVDCSTIQNSDFTLAGRTFTVTNLNCNGDRTLGVDVTVSPALGPGTYVINVANILDMCGNNMNSSYTVTLGNPPTPTISQPVAVCKNPGLLGFSYSPSSQVLTAGGGNAYEWSTGETSASITVSPTSTQTYTVKVFQNGCFSTTSTTVVVKQAAAVSLGPDKFYCGTPVTLTATPTGAGYTFKFYRAPNFISNGTLLQEGPGNTIAVSPTATTTYRVVVIDADGCEARDDIRVIVSTSTNATIDIPGNNYCVNANPVLMTAVPEGGTFSGPGVSGDIFNPATAGVGTHTISYTAVNECGTFTGTKNVSVTTGNSPSINLSGIYCVTDAAFDFSPNPRCGTFAGPGITNSGLCILGTYIISPNFSPAQAGVGIHTITYTPPTGQGFCANSTTVTVVDDGFEPLISGAGGPYCSNVSPITLTGTPSGGTFTGPGMSGNVFNPAAAGVGTHTITYTIAACSRTFSSTVRIEVLSSSPSATISYGGSPYCATVSTPQAVTFSGTPGGTYAASPGGLSINSSNGQIIPSQSTIGTYTVTYTIPATGGCPAYSQTATVSISNSITPEFNLPALLCRGATPPQLPTTSGNNITGIWNPAVVSNTASGNYTFTPNSGQCAANFVQEITVLPAPEVDAQASETLVDPGTEIQLSVSPLSQEYAYTWSPADAVSDPESPTPTAVVEEDTWFFVTASDEGECSATDSVLVRVKREQGCEENNIFLPSAFSPNGDGVNDIYKVRSSTPLESMTLVIFNRWGEKVFESKAQEDGWDGRYKGKAAAADTYGYYFEGVCDGITIKRQGNLTIIR
jgi:gliding motility-associated-like protein